MIIDDIRFVGVWDFYKRCDYIRDKYNTFPTQTKFIYKWYVYSHRRLRECTCDIIWSFLNAPDEIEYRQYKERLADERYRYKM